MLKNWFNHLINIGIRHTNDLNIKSKIRMTNLGWLFWVFVCSIYVFITLTNLVPATTIMPYIVFSTSLLGLLFTHLGYYKISWHLFIVLLTSILLVGSILGQIGILTILVLPVFMIFAFVLFQDTKTIIFYIAFFIVLIITLALFLFGDVIRPNNYNDGFITCVVTILMILGLQFIILNLMRNNREQAAKDLVKSELFFKGVFENNPLGILISDARNQGLKEANREVVNMFGYHKEVLESMKVSEMTYAEDKNAHLPKFEKILKKEANNMSIIKRYVRANGDIFYAQTSVAFVYNSKKEHTHYVATIEDIDDTVSNHYKIEKLLEELKELNASLEDRIAERSETLQHANEELERSNQDLEQFAYIASHDLQEPLRMIGNFVQLLKRRYSDKIDDEGKQYIDFAVEGVQRMSDLIR